MQPSREYVQRYAKQTGFQPDILEKVFRLLDLIRGINAHPRLRNRLVLKGGTALNLFYLPMPRLSVDIDLNYIGELSREAMLEERPSIERGVEEIFEEQAYAIRKKEEYAATLYTLRYTNSAGNTDVIQVELNFLLRISLYGETFKDAVTIDPDLTVRALILTPEEVVAGKIKALLERVAPRDLYDVFRTLSSNLRLELERVRAAVIFLGATVPDDFRTYDISRLGRVSLKDLQRELWPTLRKGEKIKPESMLEVVRPFIGSLLKFTPSECRFLDDIMVGQFNPELLFGKGRVADRVRDHPAILWKIQKVRALEEQKARKRRASGGWAVIRRRRR